MATRTASRKSARPAASAYADKRRFDKTPEPEWKKARAKGNSFVVQKHDATRLHYDFRLEMDGVLKSWAVTRGPSLDPADKRLAVHVEDHPLAYADFEGVIPKGQYGGGTVIVWDHGSWTPIGDLKKAMKKGHLEFELAGEKMKGRWHLVKMHTEGEKRENWLLIKGEDAEARPADGDAFLRDNPLSVKSGRDLPDVQADPDGVWKNGKDQAPSGDEQKKPVSKRARAEAASKAKSSSSGAPANGKTGKPAMPKGARKKALPDFVEPQLASLKPQPPKGETWLHEIKFDGYRIQARIDKGKVTLLTRSGLDWTEKFGSDLAKALATLEVETALIDGEVVVERDSGASDFSALQQDLSEGRTDRFTYYAFDLIYLDGHGLENVALIERKTLLQALVTTGDKRIRYSEHFDESGGLVLDHACRLSLEGVISKKSDGKYVSGRKGQWIKSKCSERQEFVIGGFAPSSTGDNLIGSLALGVYEKGRLRHVGRVGTGFSRSVAEDLFTRLDALKTDDSPFAEKLTADARRDLVYVEPQLLAEVEFRAWSGDGNLRHASFRGLREDKTPEQVTRESDRSEKNMKPQTAITFTHPDRIYWPDAGVTKEGLAEYYAQVWKRMAPFVVDRPLALLRCPEGIDGEKFFQKHGWRGVNKAIHQIKDPKDKEGKPALKIVDFDGLMALVQSGVLEIHPWGTTVKHWEKPDMIIMDLDPAEDVAWSAVIEAAVELKRRIEADGLAAFVKTSGGKGLHVVIPLEPKAGWARAKAYAKRLAEDLAKAEPDRYLAVSTKAKRKGKIFIDYLRNGRGNTAVAPYSTRARPGAAVSMPLSWDELSSDIGPAHFTVENTPTRLSALKSDPWENFFRSAKPLPTK
ncbi:DNA ligase D [Rhizobium halophytocola]|uniref:DNA ligase (ATP) n=1 Tax=Rhizobium halophytocola TaxID=735519 RepID=A0ABS4DU71_9HYPH|nr:DNA ligase D [Rhizobium halophytocola]MBP1849255.1 bifunctional non-homologous end joining protein LigD [Rhizobium halophytocola]